MTTITDARFDDSEEMMLDYLFDQAALPGMTVDSDASSQLLYFIPVLSGQESVAAGLTAEFTLPDDPTDREAWMPTVADWTITSGGLYQSVLRDYALATTFQRTASTVSNSLADITFPTPNGSTTGCTVTAVLLCVGKYGDATKLLPLKSITLTNPVVIPSGGGPAPFFDLNDLAITWK